MDAKPATVFIAVWQAFSNPIKAFFSNPAAAWFVLAGSLLLTAAGWFVSNKYVQQRADEAFQFEAYQAKLAIAKRMQEYELALRGCVALFDASDFVSRQEWKAYIDALNVERYFPGIQGIGFTRWVNKSEKQAFIDSVKAEGYPDFTLWPDSESEFLTSIVYLEPFVGRNLRAFGYDMFSEAKRRSAMELARDTGMAAISEKVFLVQETNQNVQNGFLMYLPVYKHGLPLTTVEQRRAALYGFVYSPFRSKDLMAGILMRAPIQVDFEIYDGTSIDSNALLYSSQTSDLAAPAFQPKHQSEDSLTLPERKWKIRFFSKPESERKMASYLPEAVAAVGLLFDALLFLIVWSIANQRRKIHHYANAMTAELARERSFLSALVGSLSETIIASDAAGEVVFINPAANELLKFNLQKTPLREWLDHFSVCHEDGVTVFPGDNSPLFRALKGECINDAEVCLLLKNGVRINVMINGRPLAGAENTKQGAVVVIRDITNDKQTLRLRESEVRFRLVFEAAQSAMIIVDGEGCIQLANAQAERLFGYPRDELVGQPIEMLVAESQRKQHSYYRGNYQHRPAPRMMGAAQDLYGMTKSGRQIPIEVGLSPIRTADTQMVLAVVVDNSQRKEAERVLLNSIQEKETLLKEIHHRVKNNMQVINSLLNLQAAHSGSEVVRDELIESQMRIKTMALIHQLLYEHQDFSKIHLQEYIERLVRLISAGYSSKRGLVKLKFELDPTPLYLDLNRAIPCGLIVNEIVTNAFKHAFSEAHEGVLTVSLTSVGGDMALLTIQDNGKGLPAEFDFENSHSLGLQLVSLLTDQLDGSISSVRDAGARFELRFNVKL